VLHKRLRCTSEATLRNSTRLLSTGSSPELTTEGLVAGCGSLVLKSIKRSAINIGRSMFDVQSVYCSGQAEFHARFQVSGRMQAI
jgi:hypothetical protein